jgi:hypothetical protein
MADEDTSNLAFYYGGDRDVDARAGGAGRHAGPTTEDRT